MSASTTKAIAAHLKLNVEVRLSVEATEAKWKELTKDYRDPNKKWEDEDTLVIESFIQEEMDYVLREELQARFLPDLTTELFFGLKSTKPVLQWSQLDLSYLSIQS